MERFETWVFDQALPLWSTEGFEGDLGFSETLSLAGRRQSVGFRRSRVHARQIYVFCHAYELGYEPGLDIARAGVEFLLKNGWAPKTGGWVVSMGEAGGIVNAELDLYEQAFVIFALSWWGRVSGDARAPLWIAKTLNVIDTQFGVEGTLGYRSRVPDLGGRLQNPHMHLLEALLTLYEFNPSQDVETRIRSLLSVLGHYLYDPDTQSLAEFYTDDWQRVSFEDGQKIEPGHHFEWCWLLSQADRLLRTDHRVIAKALFDFAEQHGVRPDNHLIFDGLNDIGTVIDDGHRSWPQTERLKALIAMHEFQGVDTLERINNVVETLMQRYLLPAPSGAWIDHLNFDGSSRSKKVPASTFYHLFLSFAELKRYATQFSRQSQNVF
ncbi:MAG: AGE family epimerase/isomerase [Pseudomonadota bacterium]